MKKAKRKGFFEPIIYSSIPPIVCAVCIVIIWLISFIGFKTTATTSEYMDNLTQSTMLDFTMLNAKYITVGTFPSTKRTCSGETLLPVKEIMGIGLLHNPDKPEDNFSIGYMGYDKNTSVGLCISPFFSSLGFSSNILQKIDSLYPSNNSISFLLLKPAAFIPKLGQTQTYTIYNTKIYYNFPGFIVNIVNKIEAVEGCTLMKYIPIIKDYCDNPDKVMASSKTTYAYIALPNGEVATIVTKTS